MRMHMSLLFFMLVSLAGCMDYGIYDKPVELTTEVVDWRANLRPRSSARRACRKYRSPCSLQGLQA